jgi:N-formylglutamate amidohydrolase
MRLSVLATLLVASQAWADEKPDLDKFLLRQKGELPIILSAPHGGKDQLPGVDERHGLAADQFVIVRDTGTLELAEKLSKALEKEFGAKPYLVAAKFERKQIDANRPAMDAYESDLAKPYYEAYHAALKSYCTEVRKAWGRGLLIDLHGQAAKADTIFRGTQNLKTVAALKTRFGMKAIIGPDSLLGALKDLGYTSYPAPEDLPDTKENPRFSGGYIVGTYGSDAGTNIDAIQLELGGDHRVLRAQEKFAKDLTTALRKFHKQYLPQEKLPN